ncbi:hypothetical protein MTO96_016109 [Rhipicephalus appendiculatus]
MISGRNVGFQFEKKSASLSSEWEPQKQRLRHIMYQLRASLSDDQTTRLKAWKKVKEMGKCADFNNYLVFIFTEMNIQYEDSPTNGMVALKNNASAPPGLFPRCVIVNDLIDVITAALGFFITTHSEIKLTRWPELLPRLGELLDFQDDRICEGAFGALHKICRNYANEMNANDRTDQLTVLLPKCLPFFQHGNPRVRYDAITFMSLLFLNRTRAMMVHADTFVTSLLRLGFDRDGEVQKAMLRALAILLEYHIECLAPHMYSIVEYVMIRMQDRNEDIALEARAIVAFLAKPICKEALTPHFSNLVHILVEGTKYCDSDIERLKEEVPSTFRRPGSTSKGRDAVNSGLLVSETKAPVDIIFYLRNMRSRSAFALEAISMVFNEELLSLLLPMLKQMLKDKDWVIRESAIFVLGVVAEGCMEDMHPHLPDLISSFLLVPIRSERAAVRSATCWTLSRYYPWVLRNPQHLYFRRLVRQLLKWVLDDDEMVQEVACNALMTLEECAKTSIVPYVDSILNTLYSAFFKYRRSRFYMLYNAIEILADSVGSEIIRSEFRTSYIRLLTDERDEMTDCRINLFFLLRCLGSVATALKSDFLPFHAAVADRCLRIAYLGRQGTFARAIRLRYSKTPKKPLTIVALEALGGLAEGVGRSMEPFVLKSGIYNLMVECASDPVPEVRQATFYLLEHFTKTCPNRLSSKSFLPLLVENLNPEITPLCNNATCAIRELTLTSGTDVEPHLFMIRHKLVQILDSPETSESLRVSTAIAIAYLCYAFRDKMAPMKHEFLTPCSSTLVNISDTKVKDFALRALFKMVHAKPCGLLQSFIDFLGAIIHWLILQDDLTQAMNDLIRHHKERWGTGLLRRFCRRLPPTLSQRVAYTYDIL